MTVDATAYDPNCSVCDTGGRTSQGVNAHLPGIAADPRVLTPGTLVTLEYLGHIRTLRVDDRGGAIKGNRVDIRVPNHKIARDFGRQRRFHIVVVSSP